MARNAPPERRAAHPSEVQRLVLEFAAAARSNPPAVSDALVRRLQDHLSDAAIVELAMTIGDEKRTVA